MRKFIITAVAATALAVPALASADAPDGTLEPSTRRPHGNASASATPAQIKQNGQQVSGNALGAVRPDDDSRLACRRGAGARSVTKQNQ